MIQGLTQSKYMANAGSHYWTLVKINAAGQCRTEEIPQAREFFQQQFPELTQQSAEPDPAIQRRLLEQIPDTSELGRNFRHCHPAECCLRCFISGRIVQVCRQIAAQFGREHGFTANDLFRFVLGDSGRLHYSATQPLAIQILQTFEPERGKLNAWTIRLVKHHRELNAFLRQQGVYLVSDWAILNDTKSNQLQRIYSQFYTDSEVQEAVALLECYHAVYRHERLQQRREQLEKSQPGIRKRCLPPSEAQLHRIAQCFCLKTTLDLSPISLLTRLQAIATRLRHYRIWGGGGPLPTELLNPAELERQIEQIPNSDDEPDEPAEFLQDYRQQFMACLDRAIAQVISNYLRRQSSQKAEQFTTGLQLYHCQGRTMSEIAQQLGWDEQYQVTRLLRLKQLRADIRRRMLELLLDYTLDIAKRVRPHPDRLRSLDQQIESALDEQISEVISEAEREVLLPRHGPLRSLLAQQLCRYLDGLEFF